MFTVATCKPLPEAEPLALRALEDLFGKDKVDTKTLPGLAGPNELLQILADVETWQLWVGAMASIFGGAFLSRLGKQSTRRLRVGQPRAAYAEAF